MKFTCLLFLALAPTVPALGQAFPYFVGQLGPPATSANAITNSGWVLAGSEVLQPDGSVQLLGPLPGGGSSGTAINASGVVVGATISPTFPETDTPTIWQSGAASALPLLRGDAGGDAYGINDDGLVVGSTYVGTSGGRAVLWQNGTVQDLSVLLPKGNDQTVAVAINNSSQIVVNANGSEAYLVSGTAATPITGPAGTYSVAGAAINNQGEVAGVAYTAAGEGRAFVWSNGAMQLAPALSDIIPFEDHPTAINDDGTVVGFYISSEGTRAFIWDGSNDIVDLNSLIDPDSGWVLDIASGINDSGDIVGLGYLDGQREGFLLTPTGDGQFAANGIPEPASLALLALGSLTLLRRRRNHAPRFRRS